MNRPKFRALLSFHQRAIPHRSRASTRARGAIRQTRTTAADALRVVVSLFPNLDPDSRSASGARVLCPLARAAEKGEERRRPDDPSRDGLACTRAIGVLWCPRSRSRSAGPFRVELGRHDRGPGERCLDNERSLRVHNAGVPDELELTLGLMCVGSTAPGRSTRADSQTIPSGGQRADRFGTLLPLSRHLNAQRTSLT